MKKATDVAAAIVKHWMSDYAAARKLSDVALGELIRRIATAIANNSKD